MLHCGHFCGRNKSLELISSGTSYLLLNPPIFVFGSGNIHALLTSCLSKTANAPLNITCSDGGGGVGEKGTGIGEIERKIL